MSLQKKARVQLKVNQIPAKIGSMSFCVCMRACVCESAVKTIGGYVPVNHSQYIPNDFPLISLSPVQIEMLCCETNLLCPLHLLVITVYRNASVYSTLKSMHI